MRAFLGYCGVVDHQHGIAAADQPIRLNKQFRLHRPRIPDPGRNEVVQLIVFAKPKPLRHRLNALTSARTDQPRHVEWTHLSPRLVTQPIHKRLEKASKLFFPIRRPSHNGRPLQSRPPMSHRKTDLGIPCRSKSAKVVLGRVLIKSRALCAIAAFSPAGYLSLSISPWTSPSTQRSRTL